jgi:hypothetical protein
MKTFIVYINGVEAGYIKAGSRNAAEKKAFKKYGCTRKLTNPDGSTHKDALIPRNISVAYTEI